MSIKNKIKAGIVGASGYTGGELLRLLVNHEGVELVFAYSTTNNGKLVSDVYTDLIGEINIEFTNTVKESDVIFLCQGHGKSYKFLLENSIVPKTKIIDLSQDFRLEKSITIGKNIRNFTYGLPELQKKLIKSSKNIANPGCFATALYPFSKIVGKANILIMPGQHSAAISYKMMKTLGDTKVIGPLLIGLGLPVEIAPLRSSTSELINLASIAAYSADVIDYKK